MADEALIDPSTLPHKEQQQLISRLRQDGQRMDAYHKITDYVNAKPTFKPVPKKRKSRAKPKPVAAVPFFPEDHLVPATAKTKAGLLARLNANLRG